MTNSRLCFVGLLVSACCALQVQGDACRGEEENWVERRAIKTLLSPGFPKPYGRNLDCSWVLRSRDTSGNYTIQIAVMEMDIKNTDGQCTNDYLQIYSGKTRKDMVPMVTWCGNNKKIFTTSDPYVRLRLVTDGHFGGRGFVLDYGLIRTSNLQCYEETPKPKDSIRVENIPVFATFRGRNNKNSCKWRIRSARAKSNLVFEVYKASQITCDVGKFVFFEGEQSSGHRNFEFCSNDRAFSKIYFAKDLVTIVLNHTAGDDVKPFGDQDDLIIKMYHQGRGSKCSDPIEVSDGPIMFSLPGIGKSGSDVNGRCRMRLQSKDAKRGLRLDVMGEQEEGAMCTSRTDGYIDVTDDVTQFQVKQLCNRGEHPVYRGSSRMLVDTRSYSTVFLRATSIDPKCNGELSRLMADPNKIKTSSLPDSEGYINLSYCQAIIAAKTPNDSVSLSLHWKRPAGEDFDPSNMSACPGDFVNVFNIGKNSTNKIRSTCQEASDEISVELFSTDDKVLVVLDADKAVEGTPVMLEYHSIPDGGQCEGQKTVNGTTMKVRSALYPDPPPLKHNCATMLTAENEEDAIIVNVIDSNLATDCMSMLTIYEGDYKGDHKVMKRICGKESAIITIYGGKAMLVTETKVNRGPGGWEAEVYTVPRSGAAGVVPGTALFIVPLLLATIHLLYKDTSL